MPLINLSAGLQKSRPYLCRERRCCRRLQNKQICLPQNADFLNKVLKAAELMFAGTVDLYKICVKVCRLTLLYRRKNKSNQKVSLKPFQT